MKKEEKITLYILSNNSSSKKIKKHYEQRGYDFEIRNMTMQPLSFSELKEILRKSEDGVNDILSTSSGIYKKLVKEGVDFESLSLSKLYEYVKEYPNLVKAPISIQGRRFMVGFRDEDIGLFIPRERKNRIIMGFVRTPRKKRISLNTMTAKV